MRVLAFHRQRNRLADKVDQHGQALRFFVEEHINHRLGGENAKALGLKLARLAHDFALDFIADGLRGLDFAARLTGGAGFAQHMRQAFAGALAGDFHQAQAGEAVQGDAGAVARLRNLGGIIIVDFIDMVREDHQQAVLSEFKKQLARDRVKTMSSGTFSQLGLVEMTRKRTRESLAHMLCEPCEACQGKGSVKTARSVCYDILREILREARQFNPREFRVVASARVVELFLDEESQHLAGLSDFIGKPISLQAESAMGQEQYDIVLL